MPDIKTMTQEITDISADIEQSMMDGDYAEVVAVLDKMVEKLDELVEKANEYFTIYVAFPGHKELLIADPEGNTSTAGINTERISPYGNFVVLTEDILASQTSQLNSIGFGACSLPTLQFKITGYPKDYEAVYTNLGTNNPTISLA